MFDRNNLPVWAGAIVLIALVFNFLNTIFKSDVKRFSPNRVYIDYSTHKKTDARAPAPVTTRRFQPSITRASLDTFFSVQQTAVEVQANAFDQFTKANLSRIAVANLVQPKQDPDYLETQRLGSISLPDLMRAEYEMRNRRYEMAMQMLANVLKAIPEKDRLHRQRIYDLMAECQFNQKNKQGYVQYKTLHYQETLKWQELVRRAFPDAQPNTPWLSSEEATKNLLRIRSFANTQLQGEERDRVIQRAEYDLEVARLMQR